MITPVPKSAHPPQQTAPSTMNEGKPSTRSLSTLSVMGEGIIIMTVSTLITTAIYCACSSSFASLIHDIFRRTIGTLQKNDELP
jgi:hypothetical protein